ncbi:cyclic-phosphate processing receiver domain-containing protein [Paenibacillus anseongense]|uniref:cyclic-phosphate processing receiver domain-containing protein n=1 Tax=Paenibacillus anseongense TaxID=2682845 RepID=UPI002DB739A2|nr:cyclic-phosphate processing receiver domain-containing protein [Paenibacillus anseongense]
MINLYVDDLRDCPDGFTVARTYVEAVELIENNEIDHDLGEDTEGKEMRNGYDFVKYICEQGLRANKIYLHTDNPVGRKNMY